ncbi:hypothetical protein ACFXTO_018516 [Malus domestica]
MHQHLAPSVGTTLIPTLFSFIKLISTIRTLFFDHASLSNMRSEESHIRQNDTPLTPGAKQRRKEQKKFAFQAKVDELEAQNNKITMKNEIFQEQYEKVFEMLHETRYTNTHELISHVEVNHQLGAPQHGGSFALDMGILVEERATNRNDDQHETSFNLAASTRSMRSGERHFLTKGVEGSKVVFHDC